MCKILTVVVAFLWVLANSTFLGHNSLPLVLIIVKFNYSNNLLFHME